MLKKILGEDVKESKDEFKEWLNALSKEQLVEKMLRKKGQNTDDSSEDDDDDAQKDSKAETGGKTNKWDGTASAAGSGLGAREKDDKKDGGDKNWDGTGANGAVAASKPDEYQNGRRGAMVFQHVGNCWRAQKWMVLTT